MHVHRGTNGTVLIAECSVISKAEVFIDSRESLSDLVNGSVSINGKTN